MDARHDPSHHPGRWSGLLLLLPTLGCVLGGGVLGDYTETDTGTGTTTLADSGSSGEPTECVEDCDPDFAVTHISGINFRQVAVHRLGDELCEGPDCPQVVSPAPVGGDAIEPCLTSEQAQESPLGAEEYCRLIPGQLAIRVDLGFATPVERSSFEHMRPRLDDASRQEAYLWHTDVVELRGPGTALRGDYHYASPGQPELQTSVINDSCAERLTALGIPWTEAQLEALCVDTWDDDGTLRPLRMDPAMVFRPYPGQLSTDSGHSCVSPDAGPDTCCSACDWMLGPGVARYGIDQEGSRRNANEGTAIACDPSADVLTECRDLALLVERDGASAYTYAWDGAEQDWPLPRYDKLRETHPDDRPPGLVAAGPSCSFAGDCAEGQACIGTNAAGHACTSGADCTALTCQPDWFGACQLGAGGTGWCVDRRFKAQSAGACLTATQDFADGSAGDRLSQCDDNTDGTLTAGECCDPALGGGPGCDPLFQPGLAPVARYDRLPDLVPAAACTCEEGQPNACAEAIDAWCATPVGSASDPGPDSPAGHYAVPALTRVGGIRWDEETALVGLRLATLGKLMRASVESCAENFGLIDERSPADGWVANEAFAPELLEDHDLALCSGSTYRLVFAQSDAEHHIRSQAQGTLDGRSEFVIETPQFRIVPGSLFPTDNLLIESCYEFSLRLSNRSDPGPDNLRKLELHQDAPDGPLVAGGPACDPLASPAEIAAGAIPCLTFDHENDYLGELHFVLDESVHGQVLQAETTYFVVLPGLADISEMSDPTAYAAAFHDACGMPLVLGQTPEQRALWESSFTVDQACP